MFNAFLGIDNKLFVDPNLFKVAKTQEFAHAREKLEQYFANVIKLLSKAKSHGDVAWEAARKMLTIKEEQGAALGYSGAGTSGSAIGPELAEQLCKRAKEIVDLGIDDPVIFELIGLFEEGFGADRLSDLAIAVLRAEFLSFTQRIAAELDLQPRSRTKDGALELPLHPDGRTFLMLIPRELLNDLPIALSRSEIDEAAAFNAELRSAWNKLFTSAGKKKRRITKDEIRAMLFSSPQNLKDLVKVYRASTPRSYDFENDPEGLFEWDEVAQDYAKEFPLEILLKKPTSLADVRVVLDSIVTQFRRNVEDNKLYELLYRDDGKPRKELYSQRLFYAIADAYCWANNVDLSREPNAGYGPVDFKVSSGYSGRVLVEVKLSSNPQLLHGFEVQLPIYQKSEATEESIYLIMRVTEKYQAVTDLITLAEKRKADGLKVPQIIVIDAWPKESASKRKS